jgi:hypothetical protein
MCHSSSSLRFAGLMYIAQKMHKPEVTGSFREIELELLCALANDIALHFEELEAVVDKFNLDEIRRKVGKN